MIKHAIGLILIFLLTNLSSCQRGDFYKKLNGGYYLSALHSSENMVLGYEDGDFGIGVIGATVFAIGQSNHFIWVKQHPKNSLNKPDKEIINYYIIPLNMKISKSVDENFYGPLSFTQFENKRKEMKISDFTFTIVFENLE